MNSKVVTKYLQNVIFAIEECFQVFLYLEHAEPQRFEETWCGGQTLIVPDARWFLLR